MKEHPIIFTSQMVRALLDGRKTQTRRLLYGKSGRRVPLATVKAGDRLYVREALTIGEQGPICYAADGAVLDCTAAPDFILTTGTMPGMFMPKWASRIWLEVLTATTERLQAISRDDCVAEGHPRAALELADEVHLDAARDWYEDLWIQLHGKASWDANPEVLVLSFEVER